MENPFKDLHNHEDTQDEDTDIVLLNNIEDEESSVSIFNPEEDFDINELHLSEKDVQLYELITANEENIKNYKISPFWNESSRELDIDSLFDDASFKMKRAAADYWLISVNWNHVIESLIVEYKLDRKKGEREFYRIARQKTNLSKHTIDSILYISRKLSLPEVLTLQNAGCQITSVKRLVAPETPEEAIDEALAEAEAGNDLKGAVIEDIIDATKNPEPDILDNLLKNQDTQKSEKQENKKDENNHKSSNSKESTRATSNLSKQSESSSTLSRSTNTDISSDSFTSTPDIHDSNDSFTELDNVLESESKPVEANESKPVDGSIIINPDNAAILKAWIKKWAYLYEPDIVRGNNTLKILNELQRIVPELSEVKIPEPQPIKRKKRRKASKGGDEDE